MPDKYRVLADRQGNIVQRGVLDYTRDQLFDELWNFDIPDWMKDNVVSYWFEVKMTTHDKAYDQVASPSAGGITPAGKHSDCTTDALGDPSRYSKQTEFTAKPTDGVKEARDKQLGSNIELVWKKAK